MLHRKKVFGALVLRVLVMSDSRNIQKKRELPPHNLGSPLTIAFLCISMPYRAGRMYCCGLELVAHTDGDTAIETCSIEACPTISEPCTDVRTVVNRQLQREPEIISHTAVTYYTCITTGNTPDKTGTGTYTETPVPLTFVVPRDRCIERVNPIVRTRSTDTCEGGQFNCQINHIGGTQIVLIRERNTITDVTTNCTRLCYGTCHRQHCHNGNQEKTFLHNNSMSFTLYISNCFVS